MEMLPALVVQKDADADCLAREILGLHEVRYVRGTEHRASLGPLGNWQELRFAVGSSPRDGARRPTTAWRQPAINPDARSLTANGRPLTSEPPSGCHFHPQDTLLILLHHHHRRYHHHHYGVSPSLPPPLGLKPRTYIHRYV